MLDQYEIKLILLHNSLFILSCSIFTITETWLTIDDSALASQFTPDSFKVLLANKKQIHNIKNKLNRCGLSL